MSDMDEPSPGAGVARVSPTHKMLMVREFIPRNTLESYLGCIATPDRRSRPRSAPAQHREPQKALEANEQMWQERAGRSRCRCGRGEPSPDEEVGGVSPAVLPVTLVVDGDVDRVQPGLHAQQVL